MLDSLDFSLSRDLFTILLLQVTIWRSDSFLVIGPSEPIVAMLGAETVLPCRVSPAMSVENMELRWFRSQISETVYLYQNGMEQVEEQVVDFKGRTELVKDYITEGRVAVRIYSLQVSDNGIYKCLFKKGNDFEEATLELKVIGLGSGPHVSIVSPEDKGIRLRCTGKGWYPQPEVQWNNARGEKMPSLSEEETINEDGLYNIQASIIVEDSSNREVSCSLKNPFFGQEQVETISIPEPFFPRSSPWKAAFAVTFFLLGIFMCSVLLLAWKRLQEKKETRNIQEEKNKETQKRESLEKQLLQRKELYQQDWRKAQLYADWRKEQFKAVAVTLDPDGAHSNLNLSDDKTKVSMKNAPQTSDTCTKQQQVETICSVLGKNSFKDGRYYWEVEVKTEENTENRWALGVCSDTVKRKGWFIESTDRNFWVMGYEDGKFKVFSSKPEFLLLRQQPSRIGVFLDYDGGDLSFYNMNDGSHIYSFTEITFFGTLRPYFSLQGAVMFVITCLDSDHAENQSNSSQKTSAFNVSSNNMDVPQEATSLLSSEGRVSTSTESAQVS
ncbi:butyrophilin subfamily 1 member A1-like [Sorex araneus]|uniref:butyrophilin subfamily 1 member A1-like n=1 Tax=Sorex araneus TaxID=42254 RepID=UPI002433557E|nr:butyrophilin subfamily 1 member A1-like [Sorex araneus]